MKVANLIYSWNQVTFQKSTEKIPEKIIPTLDKLYDEFRSFGALLNAKIEMLQNTVVDQSEQDDHELKKMSNLRECLRSAADVVSTASTTLTAEPSDRVSVKNGSEFGDVFVKDANETMLRWMASNTVYEYEDVEAPMPDPSEGSTAGATTEYQSDSDSDIENEMIRALFNDGKKRKEQGDFVVAVRYFRNCLTRFSSNASYASLTSLQSVPTCGVSKAEILELLTDTYCLLGSWSKAKTTMVAKLSITERQVGKKDELYLWDTMKLAELMMKNKEYVEAHLQGRRSLRGFKKLGEPGFEGYEKCLVFLIQLCNEERKLDEEEAYIALLGSHQRKIKRSPSSSGLKTVKSTPGHRPKDIAQPQAVSNPEAMEHRRASTESMQDAHKPLENLNQGGLVGTTQLEARTQIPVRLSRTELKIAARGIPQKAQSNPKPPSGEAVGVVGLDEDLASIQDTSSSVGPQTPATEASFESIESEATSVATEDVLGSGQQTPKSASQPQFSSENLSPKVPVHRDYNPSKPSPRPLRYTSQFIHHTYVPYSVTDFSSMIYKVAAEENAKKTKRTRRTDIEFLTAYCKCFHGRPPYFSSNWGLSGWNCMVKLTNSKGFTVSGYETEALAKKAAAAQACTMYISAADEELVKGTIKRRDPVSDKEVYNPEIDRLEYKEVVPWSLIYTPLSAPAAFLGGIPDITVWSEEDRVANSTDNFGVAGDRASFPSQETSLRRSASDSTVNRSNIPGLGRNILEKATDDTQQRKKHRRNITITHPSDLDKLKTGWSPGDERPVVPQTYALSDHLCPHCNEDMTNISAFLRAKHASRMCTPDSTTNTALGLQESPSCPICSSSLSGMSEDAASVHVNECLDVTQNSVEVLPDSTDTRDEHITPLTLIERPIAPQPWLPDGTWACYLCKSNTLQFFTENKCRSCGKDRDRRSPNSQNGFERQPFDRYRTLLTSLNLNILVTPDGNAVRRKILLLGDPLCGKTYLASIWSQDKAPGPDASILNNFIKKTLIEGHQIELVIWDTTGSDTSAYQRMRRLSYDDVHVVLMCFDIANPDSFENIEHMVGQFTPPDKPCQI